jgi:cytochrome c5
MARQSVRLGLLALSALLASDASPIHAQRLGDDMAGSMRRHRLTMMTGVPVQYRSLRNPLPHTVPTFQRGADVFARSCAACHGALGLGDGGAGKKLQPPPANLLWFSRMPMSRRDPYLFWTIAEGGKPVGSAMPAYKTSLATDDIWAVIAFLQHRLGSQYPQPFGRPRRG